MKNLVLTTTAAFGFAVSLASTPQTPQAVETLQQNLDDVASAINAKREAEEARLNSAVVSAAQGIVNTREELEAFIRQARLDAPIKNGLLAYVAANPVKAVAVVATVAGLGICCAAGQELRRLGLPSDVGEAVKRAAPALVALTGGSLALAVLIDIAREESFLEALFWPQPPMRRHNGNEVEVEQEGQPVRNVPYEQALGEFESAAQNLTNAAVGVRTTMQQIKRSSRELKAARNERALREASALHEVTLAREHVATAAREAEAAYAAKAAHESQAVREIELAREHEAKAAREAAAARVSSASHEARAAREIAAARQHGTAALAEAGLSKKP